MTITQLKYIITVADAGSMNLAARKLYISQPSLSQAVKELEKEVGVEIFCRAEIRGKNDDWLFETQGNDAQSVGEKYVEEIKKFRAMSTISISGD